MTDNPTTFYAQADAVDFRLYLAVDATHPGISDLTCVTAGTLRNWVTREVDTMMAFAPPPNAPTRARYETHARASVYKRAATWTRNRLRRAGVADPILVAVQFVPPPPVSDDVFARAGVALKAEIKKQRDKLK